MEKSEYLIELISLIEKIYQQGEFEPFIDVVQIPNRILIFLNSHPKAHPSEIGEYLNIARPTVTSYLKTLEDQGLVTRELNPDNRREIYVSLTTKGGMQFGLIISQLMGLFSDWVDVLGDEAEHLLNILRVSSDVENIGDSFKKYRENKIKVIEEE